MIITRLDTRLQFQISDDRRINVDVSRLTAAALAVERTADGGVRPQLLLSRAGHGTAERIEAGICQLRAMHEMISEAMAEIAGVAVMAAAMPLPCDDDGFAA